VHNFTDLNHNMYIDFICKSKGDNSHFVSILAHGHMANTPIFLYIDNSGWVSKG
jgi:hypothetical protein